MNDLEQIIEGLQKVWTVFATAEHELYADYVYDAIKLLKTLSVPKVLPMDEVEERDHVYIEYCHREGAPCLYYVAPIRIQEMTHKAIFHDGTGHVFSEDIGAYGIEWRCWTDEPTKEQMQETEWDD